MLGQGKMFRDEQEKMNLKTGIQGLASTITLTELKVEALLNSVKKPTKNYNLSDKPALPNETKFNDAANLPKSLIKPYKYDSKSKKKFAKGTCADWLFHVLSI